MYLPATLDEYYRGTAKRFAHIDRIQIDYEPEDFSDGSFEVMGGVVAADFSLLRAFLADHEGALFVCLSALGSVIELFFPAYFYGFVEDTFARAIHHKIEGPGFACRECVGKRELRLREYDRLLRLVGEDEPKEGIWMALSRLRSPVALAEAHRMQYQDFLQQHDRLALSVLAETPEMGMAALTYLTEEKLLSDEAVAEILPLLSEHRQAGMVAILLSYRQQTQKRRRLVI